LRADPATLAPQADVPTRRTTAGFRIKGPRANQVPTKCHCAEQVTFELPSGAGLKTGVALQEFQYARWHPIQVAGEQAADEAYVATFLGLIQGYPV